MNSCIRTLQFTYSKHIHYSGSMRFKYIVPKRYIIQDHLEKTARTFVFPGINPPKIHVQNNVNQVARDPALVQTTTCNLSN